MALRWLMACLLILLVNGVWAQRDVRAQIDSERGNQSFTDKETLEKSRSFIFRDSTYYLGHYLLGGYLFFRANDKLGFNKAIVPLRKAFELMEKDFDRELRTRSNSFNVYNAVYRYHSDYGFIAYLLEQSYQNVEMPDKAFEVMPSMVRTASIRQAGVMPALPSPFRAVLGVVATVLDGSKDFPDKAIELPCSR